MTSRQEKAVRLHQAGRLDEASAIYEELLIANPDNYHARQLLGLVAFHRGEYDRAIALISQALESKPDSASYHHNLAAVYRVLGQFEKADKHYRMALQLKPDYAEAYFNFAGVHKFIPENSLHATIEALLKRSDWSPQNEGYLRFAAGKMYDDLKMYDRAFRHYQRGNVIHGARFDAEKYTQFSDALIATFDRTMLSQRATRGFRDPTPVFVIGMPRSGTTLVEQILASHPQVHGAGELTDIISIAHSLGQHAPSGGEYPTCARTIREEVYNRLGEAHVRRLRSGG